MLEDVHAHSRPLLAIALASVVCIALSFAVAAQGSLHAERTVDWTTTRPVPLNVKVGPVVIHSVEFSDRGVAGGKNALTSLLRGAGSGSEASTILRCHFLAENPTADEWDVSFTVEFQDRNGKVIDRVTKKSSWEGESKAFDLDHPILQYVVPDIAKVRLVFEGKLD